MEPIVGIDLGTTNSEIAFIINKNAEVITDNDTGIVPSCVGLDEEGKLLVGTSAKNQAVIWPERTILSVKRKMGSNETIQLGDHAYRPQEISAFILKHLKERAERKLNQKISKAIITVPAYFTDAQRQATREAGEIGGLNVIRILNEPTAAALAYEKDQSEKQHILVFDLGGGTFDVSIVKIENKVIEVLASTGDTHLGGDDFDEKIVKRVVEYIKNEQGLDVSGDRKVLARLRQAAENAKITLSSAPFAIIEEDHIGKKLFKDVHLSYELSRKDFESLIDDELKRTLEAVNKALDDSSLLPGDIDRIILVGGSTRIPAISEILEEKFNIKPHSEIDPDLCVALGAAIQAGREMGIEGSSVLLDVTPYTFGTSAFGSLDGAPYPYCFIPLIKRNTKLPTSKSEAFTTMVDNQVEAALNVYQGENRNALENVCIGNFSFTLTKAPAGAVIVLNYDLDINGILKLKAVEKKTGKQIEAVIENAFKEFSEDEIKKAREKIDHMWEENEAWMEDDDGETDPERDLPDGVPTGEIPVDITEILTEAKKKLDSAPEEDKDQIINLIEDITNLSKEARLEEARVLKQDLEDILFYID